MPAATNNSVLFGKLQVESSQTNQYIQLNIAKYIPEDIVLASTIHLFDFFVAKTTATLLLSFYSGLYECGCTFASVLDDAHDDRHTDRNMHTLT